MPTMVELYLKKLTLLPSAIDRDWYQALIVNLDIGLHDCIDQNPLPAIDAYEGLMDCVQLLIETMRRKKIAGTLNDRMQGVYCQVNTALFNILYAQGKYLCETFLVKQSVSGTNELVKLILEKLLGYVAGVMVGNFRSVTLTIRTLSSFEVDVFEKSQELRASALSLFSDFFSGFPLTTQQKFSAFIFNGETLINIQTMVVDLCQNWLAAYLKQDVLAEDLIEAALLKIETAMEIFSLVASVRDSACRAAMQASCIAARQALADKRSALTALSRTSVKASKKKKHPKKKKSAALLTGAIAEPVTSFDEDHEKYATLTTSLELFMKNLEVFFKQTDLSVEEQKQWLTHNELTLNLLMSAIGLLPTLSQTPLLTQLTSSLVKMVNICHTRIMLDWAIEDICFLSNFVVKLFLKYVDFMAISVNEKLLLTIIEELLFECCERQLQWLLKKEDLQQALLVNQEFLRILDFFFEAADLSANTNAKDARERQQQWGRVINDRSVEQVLAEPEATVKANRKKKKKPKSGRLITMLATEQTFLCDNVKALSGLPQTLSDAKESVIDSADTSDFEVLSIHESLKDTLEARCSPLSMGSVDDDLTDSVTYSLDGDQAWPAADSTLMTLDISLDDEGKTTPSDRSAASFGSESCLLDDLSVALVPPPLAPQNYYEPLKAVFPQLSDQRFIVVLGLLSTIATQCGAQLYAYGSIFYKERPGDIDILFLQHDGCQQDFFANLIHHVGGPQKNYTKNKAAFQYQLLAFVIEGLSVEFIMPRDLTLSLEQHRNLLDFTAGAQYYDLLNQRVITQPSFFEDSQLKRLRTICDAEMLFRRDPSTLLRATRLVGGEGFVYEASLIDTIMRIFQAENIFVAPAIKPAKLYQEYVLLFYNGNALNNMSALLHLNLLTALFPAIKTLDSWQQACTLHLLSEAARLIDYHHTANSTVNHWLIYAAAYWFLSMPGYLFDPVYFIPDLGLRWGASPLLGVETHSANQTFLYAHYQDFCLLNPSFLPACFATTVILPAQGQSVRLIQEVMTGELKDFQQTMRAEPIPIQHPNEGNSR